MKISIGIDIGGTSTKYGIVSPEGKVLFQGSIPTQSEAKFEDFIKILASEIKKGLDPKEHKLLGIGVGAPNANYHKGTIEHATNLRWKGILPLANSLEDEFQVPVVITNDANAAAVGEMIFGGAKNIKDFIVITLGTGLGAGIVSNGKIVNGAHGLAGELGHTTVNYVNGRFCGCGKRGCLETYVSATGIKRTVYKLLADHTEDSELRSVSFDELSAEMITKYALKDDFIAKKAFEYTGRILGTKLADTVVHSDPEAIFIFGGLSLAGDLIFNPTKFHMEKHLMPVLRGKINIISSQLQNQSAPIIGASSLVIDMINEKESEIFGN
ncbi:ROK family protein [Marivirga sp. S37H4]|uniref:ROK family protein n=1 Tax=Marivirga aurantiaca TaxID=2802615 RepID=A0A934WV01_9BACT|nr:ROK family protein [Marivirga aurantiaca]MBK6263431.1 ROK family protein [Marivirga aurantiaca]